MESTPSTARWALVSTAASHSMRSAVLALVVCGGWEAKVVVFEVVVRVVGFG